MLKFITGNNGKFGEMRAALAPIKLKMVEIDLDEIQSLDAKQIISHKIKEALKHYKKDFIVEDTCLYFEAFKNKLPGPFVRWFLEVDGPVGLYHLAKKLNNANATLSTMIAYVKSPKQIIYFQASTKGRMVKSKGKLGFGLDPVFLPNGSTMTLAETTPEQRAKFSPRHQAALKLKRYLRS